MSHRRRCCLALALAAAVVALAALPLRADTVETDDGKTITGRIVDQTSASVTVEVRTDGMSFRRKIAAAHVKHITRDAADGPGYYPLPIVGEIGTDVTAEAFGRALDEVRKARPQFVVLVIDCVGGSGPEMLKIADRLRAASSADDLGRDTRFIAYVKRAYSAGAVIAMACPQIYFAPDGTMGAGVPSRLGPGGKAVRLDDRSIFEVGAQMRAAAAPGGHNELILRAMMEPELELVLVQDDEGRPQVMEQGGNTLFGAKPFKSAGRVVQLTAHDAVRCGLAAGVVDDVDSLHQPLGLSAWHKSDDAGWYVMTDAGRHNRHLLDQQRQQQQAGAMAGAGDSPEIARLKSQLKAVEARGSAAQQKLDALKAAFQKEQEAAQDEYKQAIAVANSAPSPAMAAAEAVHKRNARLKKANETYPPQIAAAQKAMEDALAEYNAVVSKANKLVASGAE